MMETTRNVDEAIERLSTQLSELRSRTEYTTASFNIADVQTVIAIAIAARERSKN